MRKIKIGLALGSGAARGWSHIGVINALKKVGIEIDIVAGCSIGSLVGAAYACDRLSALEDWVTSFSYWDVLRLMDLSWQRGGLLRGERVFNQYREIMPETEIENCSRRFAAVATNLSTGRELWFTEGDLHLAIRASCSIPGLMAPVAQAVSQMDQVTQQNASLVEEAAVATEQLANQADHLSSRVAVFTLEEHEVARHESVQLQIAPVVS